MKKIYILIILILIFATSVQTYAAKESLRKWKKITNIPLEYINNYWLDVYFLPNNPLLGWICGYKGMVLRTTDGGKSWDGVTLINGGQLESICFPSEKIGYTSGNGRIYKTTDGGFNWEDITPFDATTLLWGNYFYDDNNGMVIGGICATGRQDFYRTTNGGNTWSKSTYFVMDSKLSDLILRPDGFGIATSSGVVWTSSDGGYNWKVLSQSVGFDWQEEITLSGRSILLPYSGDCDGTTGNDGGMKFSPDYGKTWRKTNVGASMFGAFLLDSVRGWACGVNESLYYTSDAGISWTAVDCGLDPGADLDDIWFKDDTTAWVVGNGVYELVPAEQIPAPTITAMGDTVLCSGDSVVLKLNVPVSNVNYVEWSTGEKNKMQITVHQSGLYSAFIYTSTCDTATSLPIKITFVDKPDLTIDGDKIRSICEGDSATFVVKETIPFIEWTGGVRSNTFVTTQTGKYYVKASNDFGCVVIDSVEVTVHPLPDPIISALGNTNVCQGDSVILMANSNYSSIEWYDSTRNAMVGTDRQLIVKTSGGYFVKVTNEFGCSAISPVFVIEMRADSNRLAASFISSESDYFFIDSTLYPAISCRDLSVRNTGSTPVTLNNVYLYHKFAFSIPQSQLPLLIPPGEVVNIRVCYSPTDPGFQTDTIELPDACSSHLIPVLGYGEMNNYNLDSKCGTGIDFRVIDLQTGTTYLPLTPYPNPAQKKVTVKFNSMIVKNSIEQTGTAHITDLYGKRWLTVSAEILNENNSNDTRYIEGQFNFDIQSLPRGYYIIETHYGNCVQLFPIITE